MVFPIEITVVLQNNLLHPIQKYYKTQSFSSQELFWIHYAIVTQTHYFFIALNIPLCTFRDIEIAQLQGATSLNHEWVIGGKRSRYHG